VVSLIADFEKLTTELQNFDHVLVADQGGTSGKPPSSGSVAVVVGPEGGFGEEEIEKLNCLKHLARIKLAGYTLRVETAAAAALALVSHPSNE
jgi:RsmE family RNA methyltransferase